MKKSMLDAAVREELVKRVNNITPATQRQWGVMRPDQVVHHLNRSISYSLGDYTIPYKRNILMSLLKPFLITAPIQKAKFKTFEPMNAGGTYDIEAEKKQFAEYIQRYADKHKLATQPKSPIFGSLTATQWGLLDYNHTDHHLRQFGV